MGYHRAGFDVVGVDINPQPNYPFEFHHANALEFPVEGFDAIHASPPCDAYTTFAKQAGTTGNHPDLIEPTRAKLRGSSLPYVIENVVGAPLEAPLLLCGTMFPALRVIRHRLFETSFFILNPLKHGDHPPVHFKHGNRMKDDTSEWRDFLCVVGGNRDNLNAVRDAIGCPWMDRDELAQAIPPAYTKWLGEQMLNAMEIAA